MLHRSLHTVVHKFSKFDHLNLPLFFYFLPGKSASIYTEIFTVVKSLYHARLFPKDKINRHYLDSFARKIDYLEGEIDSWKMWVFRMLPEMARRKVNILCNEVFCLMTKMGPAAEAQHFAVFPVWSHPKTTIPGLQILLTKIRKFKKASQPARKQAHEANAGLSAAKAEIAALTVDNLCLHFKNLKI